MTEEQTLDLFLGHLFGLFSCNKPTNILINTIRDTVMNLSSWHKAGAPWKVGSTFQMPKLSTALQDIILPF